MTRYDRRVQVLAGVLAGLAGYVDASGFGATGGSFVSFMSGNSTRLGVGLTQGARTAALAGGLIACFVIGVFGGALIGHAVGRWRPSVILVLVAATLGAGAELGSAGWLDTAAAIMSAGMGAMNNVFERDGQVSIPLTYMTGSLVKLGQSAAAALLGADRLGWLSYLVLWTGFVGGVLCGAAMYQRFGLVDLWPAAAAACLLALVAADVRTERR